MIQNLKKEIRNKDGIPDSGGSVSFSPPAVGIFSNGKQPRNYQQSINGWGKIRRR